MTVRQKPPLLFLVPLLTASSTRLDTEMALNECLPNDRWHFVSLCDISPTRSLWKEQKLLCFDPLHCQSLPNPTIWECERLSWWPNPSLGRHQCSPSAHQVPCWARHLTLLSFWPAHCPGGVTEYVWMPLLVVNSWSWGLTLTYGVSWEVPSPGSDWKNQGFIYSLLEGVWDDSCVISLISQVPFICLLCHPQFMAPTLQVDFWL